MTLGLLVALAGDAMHQAPVNTHDIARTMTVSRQVFIERDYLVTATTLERMGAIVLVAQEILQRAEEKSAKPSLLPIHAAQRILREQLNEEPLDKILRIRGVKPAMAQKTIKWRPIRFA